jgi:hypothetical protein
MSLEKYAVLCAGIVVGWGGGARAEESPYCRRVRAQAAADAAVLQWPKAFVEGIRFPSSNRLDLGPTVGSNFQGRFGVAFSPMDWYRGALVRRAGDADCAEHEVADHAEDLLEGLDDAVKLVALRLQAAYLDEHREEWRAVVARASQRFDARVITSVEVHELRWLADSLERKRAQVRGELTRLEPPGGAAAARPSPLGGLADSYVSSVGTLDVAVARLRSLDAWSFKLSGGIIPLPGQPLDWFGLAEIAYSLGGPARNNEMTRAMDAHRDEVRSSRRELPARIARARSEALARIAGAREELEVVEAQLAVAGEAGRALEGADAPGAAQARDTLVMERLSVEADRVFLQALVDGLQTIVNEGEGHGS